MRHFLEQKNIDEALQGMDGSNKQQNVDTALEWITKELMNHWDGNFYEQLVEKLPGRKLPRGIINEVIRHVLMRNEVEKAIKLRNLHRDSFQKKDLAMVDSKIFEWYVKANRLEEARSWELQMVKYNPVKNVTKVAFDCLV